MATPTLASNPTTHPPMNAPPFRPNNFEKNVVEKNRSGRMSDRVEAQVLSLEMSEPFERPLDRSGVGEITAGDRRVHDLPHQSDSARIG